MQRVWAVSNPGMQRVWAVLAAAMLSACAAHKPPTDPRVAALAAIDRADARLRDGCYACLIEARDAYVGLLTSPLGDLARQRRFEAELLIVLREKELAIDTTSSMTRLATAGAGLPSAFEVPRILARLSMLLPMVTGISDAAYADFVKVHRPDAMTATADLDRFAAVPLYGPVRDYLAWSIRCNAVTRMDASVTVPGAAEAGADEPPLLVYRRAICRGPKGLDALAALYASHPEMAEAAYYLSVNEPLNVNGPTGAKRKLTGAAYAAFPLSPAVTYAMAIVSHSAGNCREGLKYYEETLVLQERHESAELGRATCLTYLKRPDEAIAAATTLIGWNSTKVLEAYYWRAYNEHEQQHLDVARADIEASKQRGSTTENMILAGVIEYEQDDLAPAMADLDRAWALSRARGCTAAWYLGLVHIKRDAWPEAAGGFERATACFAANVREDRMSLAAVEATGEGSPELDPEFRASQIAGFKAAIVEDERQQRAAALNAATCYANAGSVARARQFLVTAEQEPSFADQVAKLREFMEKANAPSATAAGGASPRPPIQ
jgi:tetratricopeptide (TPR) repeat protein